MSKEKDMKIRKAQIDFEQDMMEVAKAEQERKQYSVSGKKARNKTYRRRIITGAVFTALAFIGMLSILGGVVKTGMKIMDNSGEKQEYNSLLTTLVMYDPLPFETPDAADQRVLLASSLWAAIMNEDMTVYDSNEFGETLLPAVDVGKHFARVFGTQIQLTHGTFTDSDVEFVYDEEKRAYVIPATNFPTGFAPQVEKIKTSFTEKVVTVGYLSPRTSWADTSERTVSKYVDYIFEKQDGSWALVAVRESEMKVELPQATDAPDATQTEN